MKGQIRNARLKLDSDNPIHPTAEEVECHQCPYKCGEAEGNLHYIECNTNQAKDVREKAINRVLRRLRALRTCERITSIIGYVLKTISNGDELVFDLKDLQIEDNSYMDTALKGQQQIGWKDFCQGFVHKGWAESQRVYFKERGLNSKYFNISRWSVMLSTILGEYCLDCWERRNKALHGETKEDARDITLRKLRKQVRLLYAKKKELRGHKNKQIFDMPMKKRMKMGVQSTKLWIGMAEEVLKLHRENATKLTLDQWLQPT